MIRKLSAALPAAVLFAAGALAQTVTPNPTATGAMQASPFPALSGDVTTVYGSTSTVLSPSGVTAGNYTNADITVNAKGQITAAANGSGGGGSGRTLLTSSVTYYVSTTGSDSNSGTTTGTAFLTVGKCADTIVRTLDLGGNPSITAVCSVGAGTFTEALSLVDVTGAAPLISDFNGMVPRQARIVGAGVGTTILQAPAAVADGAVVVRGALAYWHMQDMTIDNRPAGDYSSALTVTGHASVTLGDMGFKSAGNDSILNLYYGGFIQIPYTANITVEGNFFAFLQTYTAASAQLEMASLTLVGTPAMSGAFIYTGAGKIYVFIATPSITGTATGPRYYGQAGCLIYPGDGGASSSYLPGDSSGTLEVGGQYATTFRAI